MRVSKSVISAVMALTMLATSNIGSANAAPMAVARTAMTVAASDAAGTVETVRYRRHRHHRDGEVGAALALGAAAFIAGAAIASSRRDCYLRRTKIWSSRHGWVIKEHRVCD